MFWSVFFLKRYLKRFLKINQLLKSGRGRGAGGRQLIFMFRKKKFLSFFEIDNFLKGVFFLFPPTKNFEKKFLQFFFPSKRLWKQKGPKNKWGRSYDKKKDFVFLKTKNSDFGLYLRLRVDNGKSNLPTGNHVELCAFITLFEEHGVFWSDFDRA